MWDFASFMSARKQAEKLVFLPSALMDEAAEAAKPAVRSQVGVLRSVRRACVPLSVGACVCVCVAAHRGEWHQGHQGSHRRRPRCGAGGRGG